jgi:hypothetical protein
MASHPKPVAIRILHIHFANTPGHIRGRLTNDRAAALVLLMQRIHVLHENADPCSGLPLPSFTEENLDLAASYATEGRGIAPIPFLLETKLIDVSSSLTR